MTAVAPSMFIGTGRSPARVELRLYLLGGLEVAALDRAVLHRLLHQAQQRCPPRVDRVEAVTEARHVAQLLQFGGDRGFEAGLRASGVDAQQNLHALLTGAAVDVTKHVDPLAMALLSPTPQVTAMRALAIEGACVP